MASSSAHSFWPTFAIADEGGGSRLELADAFFRTDEDDVRIREETERMRTLG